MPARPRPRLPGRPLLALGLAGLAALLLACGAQGGRPYRADGSLALRVVSPFPRPSILAASTRFFEEELRRRYGDRLEIRSFYGGSLVGPEETLEAVGQGVADAGTGLWIYEPGRLPLGSFEYHFVFNDPDFRTQAAIKREMYRRLPALREELAAQNVSPPLVFGPLSPYRLLSRAPIGSLEDLRGKRVGITPVEYVPLFRAVGAVPVLSPAGEFYERLGLGVVDAVAVSVEILHLFHLHELAPHLLDLALNTPTTLSVWTNLDYWRALEPEDRAHFREAGRRAEARYLDLLEGEVARARRALLEAGVELEALEAAAVQRWMDALPRVARRWARRMDRRGLPGSAVVETYVELSRAAGWERGLELAR